MMISIKDYKVLGKKGILIEYDNHKEIFFSEKEAEEVRISLNNRGIGNRILNVLEDENSTIEEITMRLGLDNKTIRNEIFRLEKEGRVAIIKKKRKVCHQDLGLIFLPIYEFCKNFKDF